jgi:ribonuclease P protein component
MKSDLSFSSNNRIKKSPEFQAIYRKGNKISGYYYTAFFVPSVSIYSRLGISVPKRLGNAVFRNRQKRIVRDIFRHRRAGFSVPTDLVILMNRVPKEESKKREDLEFLLGRVIEKCKS